MSEPASIRYKNPSAMWPGPRATKWGSKSYVTLNDGQGNKIAVFPTFVQGAAAAFDLWSSNYVGMTLKTAIDKWSGHNSPSSYVNYLTKNTDIPIKTMMTRELLSSDRGWKLLKYQSHWEAGKAIPMTDDEWAQAQAMVFKNVPQPVELPYLRKGDKGADVRRLQILLGQHSKPVEVDADFGNQTRDAVMAFQESVHLRDDGIVGPLTWKALGWSGSTS